MARGFRGRRSSRPASSRQWTGAQVALAATAGAFNTAFWIILPSDVAILSSPTVLATRVATEIYRSTAIGAGAGCAFAFGIIVATGDEDAATVPTIYPDPLDDWRADWIWRNVAPHAGGSPAALYTVAGADTVIVSKAKRKIPYGSGLLIVFQTDSASTFTVTADVRCLLVNG